jgi:hypothetical protein
MMGEVSTSQMSFFSFRHSKAKTCLGLLKISSVRRRILRIVSALHRIRISCHSTESRMPSGRLFCPRLLFLLYPLFLYLKGGFFLFYVRYSTLHHLLPLRFSTVSEDAGIESRTVATTALAVRRYNHSARSHPQSANLIHTQLNLIHTRLDLIHARLDHIHTRPDLITQLSCYCDSPLSHQSSSLLAVIDGISTCLPFSYL